VSTSCKHLLACRIKLDAFYVQHELKKSVGVLFADVCGGMVIQPGSGRRLVGGLG